MNASEESLSRIKLLLSGKAAKQSVYDFSSESVIFTNYSILFIVRFIQALIKGAS